MKMSRKTRVLAWATMIGLGAQLTIYGVNMAQWRSEQIDFFNAGVSAYQEGNAENAVEFFDRSLSAYQRTLSAPWMERFVYPRADVELAARAAFLKGMAHIRSQQAEPAVAALRHSLRLNPGRMNAYYAADGDRLSELSMFARFNLELLFNQRPDLAYAQGAGRNASEGGPDAQRLPGQNPGNMPGPGNRDDL